MNYLNRAKGTLKITDISADSPTLQLFNATEKQRAGADLIDLERKNDSRTVFEVPRFYNQWLGQVFDSCLHYQFRSFVIIT
jgi:hypothetical protein